VLEHLLAARLAERHGVNLYQDPAAARAVLCRDSRGAELWAWIDPATRPTEQPRFHSEQSVFPRARWRVSSTDWRSCDYPDGNDGTDRPDVHGHPDELERAVVGRRRSLELVLIGILAGGHVLLEDLPGWARPSSRGRSRECSAWTSPASSSP